MANLLSRQEIIDLWSKQGERYLSMYCCPDCRDLLHKSQISDNLICKNNMCYNSDSYKIK